MADSAKYLIEQDLTRYGRGKRPFGLRVFLWYMFVEFVPGISFSIAFRLCQHYKGRNKFLFYFFFSLYRRIKYRYGIDISYRTKIGKGLYIGHAGGIVIHGDAVIGENFTLSQGVTIGILNRGRAAGIPNIGNNVFVGPGAVILGGISVGDDALIGTNSVVHFNVPASSVVAAPASQVVSQKGSKDYVQNPV